MVDCWCSRREEELTRASGDLILIVRENLCNNYIPYPPLLLLI